MSQQTDPASAPVLSTASGRREVYRPQRVLIVGGGTAGWMTAALLRRTAPPEVSITLVESANIPTIGVGEATLPGLRRVLRYIGIDEAEFLVACDASFKLGIRFSGWNPDRDYWHPFGAVRGPRVLIDDWLRRASIGNASAQDVPAVDDELDQGTWRIAGAHLAPQSAARAPFTGDLNPYAYHVDAAQLALLLTRHAVAAGVEHVIDDVTGVGVRSDGWVEHVETAAHGRLSADLFFDCTGFRALLINGALGEPFDSYADQLWCDRAVALNVPQEPAEYGDLAPYTRSSALRAGWAWQIPLFTRSGNGYVYSSAHLAPDEAEAELRRFLGAGDEIAARHIRIRVGKSRRIWVGNCIAVGLAGGFIEPLESTGIALIEDVGEFFVRYSPDLAWNEAFADRVNAHFDNRYAFIRDFVACHYATASRDDTAFWSEVRRDPAVLTPGIADVLDQWHRGELTGLQLPDGTPPPFAPESWAYIIGGNGVRPTMADGATIDEDALAAARAELAVKTADVLALADILPDNRMRIRELREAWSRGERAQAAPDPGAYADLPRQTLTGYLSDGDGVPLAARQN